MSVLTSRVRTGMARRAVVQLAAVLSVVHTLRIAEQRIEWRSKYLKLVDLDHERRLFEVGGLALTWGSSSLGPRALKECDGEPFQELSLAVGLLGWLAWETELDVRAAVERTNPIDLKEEDKPWYLCLLFIHPRAPNLISLRFAGCDPQKRKPARSSRLW